MMNEFNFGWTNSGATSSRDLEKIARSRNDGARVDKYSSAGLSHTATAQRQIHAESNLFIFYCLLVGFVASS